MYRSLYTAFTSIAEKHHYQICNNNVCTSDSCVPAANGQNSNVFIEAGSFNTKGLWRQNECTANTCNTICWRCTGILRTCDENSRCTEILDFWWEDLFANTQKWTEAEKHHAIHKASNSSSDSIQTVKMSMNVWVMRKSPFTTNLRMLHSTTMLQLERRKTRNPLLKNQSIPGMVHVDSHGNRLIGTNLWEGGSLDREDLLVVASGVLLLILN